MSTTNPATSITNLPSLTDMKDKFMNIIKNLDEEYQTYLVLMIIIIIVLIYLSSLSYISSLKTKDCDYMNNLYPDIDGYIVPISDSNIDAQFKLFDYYIKTAYNACSGGNYKNSYVDVCNLKAVIKQGVRCLDFEIYSLENEPIVSTSTEKSFYVKETFNSVAFSSVMSIINSHAFASGTCPNPTDPLLIHLRIKSNNQLIFTRMAEIFSNYDKMLGYDYSYIYTGENLGQLPIIKFKSKIIVIVENSNKAFMENEKFLEYVNITSNGIFMRAYNFYDIKNNPDINEITDYNKSNMTIVLPDKGMNPGNPNGMVCRTYGCQLVAMRYQEVDNFLKENTSFFDRGAAAFVLKPKELRYEPIIIPDPPEQNPALSFETRTEGNQYFTYEI